jgi:hypothetical protein
MVNSGVQMSAEEAPKENISSDEVIWCCGRVALCKGCRTAIITEQVSGRHTMTTYQDNINYYPLDGVYVPGTGFVE